MRRQRPRKTRKDFRRQGVVLLVLIIVLIISLIALAAVLLIDLFSANVSKTTDSIAESTPGITAKSTEGSPTLEVTTSTTGESNDSEMISSETTAETTAEGTQRIPPTLPATVTGPDLTGYVIVLDPGGQEKPNLDQEPLMPVMSGSKDKISAGGIGVITGRPEYEINLEIAILARDYLESLGCVVHLTRIENDVDISNVERAQFAISRNPDAYIRLYCNSESNSGTHGISVSVADSGKYRDRLVGWGDLLGTALSETTGEVYNGCDASSFYSGLNWATDIPSFMLKMGYLTNKEEDLFLSYEAYQLKICAGIADFISQMPNA